MCAKSGIFLGYMAAAFLGYMAAAFLRSVFSGNFFCHGSSADFSTQRGGRTDFYLLLANPQKGNQTLSRQKNQANTLLQQEQEGLSYVPRKPIFSCKEIAYDMNTAWLATFNFTLMWATDGHSCPPQH